MHIDRCKAVMQSMHERRVVGLEMWSRSRTYEWAAAATVPFQKITLFSEADKPGTVARLRRLLQICREIGRGDYFLCNYQDVETLLLAIALRLSGSRVYVMWLSKFDDYHRYLWRELGKSVFLKPYHGAISSGVRAKDYLRFLGIRSDSIAGEYNTLSIDRVQKAANRVPAPGGTPFQERSFVAVARLVPKKNISMLLDAYDTYRHAEPAPRPLVICGSGPLEGELVAKARELGLDHLVSFRGFLQSDAISAVLAESLCLLLPSIEEQFGNAVIEAQAMGLPVILSDNCGARDLLVRNGVTGFVVEPDNPEGMAWFMLQLARDEALWRRMSERALAGAHLGDVSQFVRGVQRLVALNAPTDRSKRA